MLELLTEKQGFFANICIHFVGKNECIVAFPE